MHAVAHLGSHIRDQSTKGAAPQAGCELGTGIGAGLVVTLWFMGFIVLALIWFMTRSKERSAS
jgi:hypothetical protein